MILNELTPPLAIHEAQNQHFTTKNENGKKPSILILAQAKVELHWADKGHQLTMQEVEAAATWYRKVIIK